MHTGQYRIMCGPLTFDQRQMHATTCLVLVGSCGEVAKSSVQHTGAHFLNQRLGTAAVFNQIGDGADFQTMLCRKNLQIRQTRHGAVVLHDFADHAAG